MSKDQQGFDPADEQDVPDLSSATDPAADEQADAIDSADEAAEYDTDADEYDDDDTEYDSADDDADDDDVIDAEGIADDGDDDEDSGDRELVGAGVAAAGSARAAARLSSASRTGVTEKKGRATTARGEDDNRGSIFSRLGRYLREVVAELRKVIWPGRKQMITYTLVVVLFVTFMVTLVWALDLGFAKAVLSIFG